MDRNIPIHFLGFLFAIMLVALALGILIGLSLGGATLSMNLAFNGTNSVIDNF
jgi:hypothetical protein